MAIWAFAVMSNQMHVVVEIIPQAAEKWSAEEVVALWLQLYSRQEQDVQQRLTFERTAISRKAPRVRKLGWHEIDSPNQVTISA